MPHPACPTAPGAMVRALLTGAWLLLSALAASAEPRHVYLTYSGAPETSIDVDVILPRELPQTLLELADRLSLPGAP